MEETQKSTFRLEPNYPNPFSRSTTLAFTLKEPGHATLRVCDVTGRDVARPVDQSLPAGSYQTAFDADDLSSGVYLVRLHVDGAVALQPLVVHR